MRAKGPPGTFQRVGDVRSIWDPGSYRQNGFSPAGGRRPHQGDNGPVLEMTREEFEELVAEALDRIPPELTRLMDNVAVFVEDDPPADDPELLGLYEGTPLTDRGEWYAGVLPDRITIYRNPTLRMCEDRESVVVETEVTVVHDIPSYTSSGDESAVQVTLAA